MRKVLILLVATVWLTLPSVANAAPFGIGQTLQINHHPNGSVLGGGPFIINLPNPLQDFVSFCLEMSASLSYDLELRVTDISTSAKGPNAPDPISSRTAFWYWRYLQGDPTYSGPIVQWMIWCEEDEYDCSAIPTAAQIVRSNTNAAMQSFGWNPNSLYGFEVATVVWFNPTNGQNEDRQDFLIPGNFTPGTPVTPVPEPGSLLLFGSGLLGAAMKLRRRRR